MSVEEDVELRDLVTQTLESNGCLAKIRAQLRASIFLALDEDVEISKQQPLLNNKVKTYLKTKEGKAVFCIVREFLEFFNLDVTMSVFEPESYMGCDYQYEGRQKIVNDLGLDILEDATVPLLMQLINIAQAKTKSSEVNLNINAQENKSLSLDINPTSNLKSTDSMLNDSQETRYEHYEGADVTSLESTRLDLGEHLNTTFEESNPTLNLNHKQKITFTSNKKNIAFGEKNSTLQVSASKKGSINDGTNEETISSIPEDITVISSTNDSKLSEGSPNSSFQEISKESKSTDKSKSSHKKSENSKSKNTVSSLSDLPPLQLNKSRVNDILPSLYSKEFQDKSNLHELDKLFDMDGTDYEEDFICSSDDLSLKSNYLKSDNSRINLLDLESSNKTSSMEKSNNLLKRDLKQKIPNRISDVNKPLLRTLLNNYKGKDIERRIESLSKDERGSISSISENIEISTSD